MALGATAEHRVEKGVVIFRQGDPGDAMFVISSGRVRLTIEIEGRPQTIAELGAGEFFGELSLLSGSERTATAQALEDTVLLAIRPDGFAMMMQDDLEVVFRMMNALGARLADTDRQLHELAHRLAQMRIAVHGLAQILPPGPRSVDLEGLAATLGVAPRMVEETVRILTAQGGGVVQSRRWRLEGEADVGAVLAALARLADGRQ